MLWSGNETQSVNISILESKLAKKLVDCFTDLLSSSWDGDITYRAHWGRGKKSMLDLVILKKYSPILVGLPPRHWYVKLHTKQTKNAM